MRGSSVTDETSVPPTRHSDHGILFHTKVRLVCFRPLGALDEEAITLLVKQLEEKENVARAPFDRFTDTSKLDATHLDLAFVYRIALYRRGIFADRPPVKSAFYVTNTAAARVVELHARVTENSPLHVRLFEDLDSAARWLGVSRGILDS